MRIFNIASLGLLMSLASVQAGPEHLIKQRAKDVAAQNNERQGVPPSQPSAPPQSQPAPAPQPAQPAGPPLSTAASGIRDALASLQKSDGASDEQRGQLEKALGAAATGKAKPSPTVLGKLSTDLAKTVPGSKLNSTGQAWLAAQLESILKGSVTAKEMEGTTTAVHDFLRQAGAGRVDAMVVKNDLKAVIVELQQAVAK